MKALGVRHQAIVNKILAFICAVVVVLLPTAYGLTPIYAQQATLSMSPSTGTFNRGCQFTVDVKLVTGSAQTDGTDAILLYDTSKLTTNTNSIASGTIYPDYPGNNVDEQAGRITISGLSSVTSAFSGQGNLATITFTVKEAAPLGSSKVSFDFDPNDKGKTTDSNVVERGTVADVLSTIIDGNYTIGAGKSCAGGAGTITTSGGDDTLATPSGGISDGSTGYEKKSLNDFTNGKGPGTPELTYTVAIVGATLTILGMLGFMLL